VVRRVEKDRELQKDQCSEEPSAVEGPVVRSVEKDRELWKDQWFAVLRRTVSCRRTSGSPC